MIPNMLALPLSLTWHHTACMWLQMVRSRPTITTPFSPGPMGVCGRKSSV
jgi:hypothetical protein